MNRIVFGLMFAALAVLFAAAYMLQQTEPLLIAAPLAGASVSVQAAEDLNENLPLTYENRRPGSIRAINARHDAVIIGTNDSFPLVLGFRVVHGRFFGREAVEHRHNTAVLNEHAAEQFFGTVRAAGNIIYIGGAPTVVAGVIADGNPNAANIYVPAVSGERTETLAVNLSQTGVEAVTNELRQIGVTHTSHHFVNFAVLAQMARDRLFLALSLAGLLALFFAARKGLGMILPKVPAAIALLPTAAAAIALLPATAARILFIWHHRQMLSDARAAAFFEPLAEAARWHNISAIMFWGFAAGCLILLTRTGARGKVESRKN